MTLFGWHLCRCKVRWLPRLWVRQVRHAFTLDLQLAGERALLKRALDAGDARHQLIQNCLILRALLGANDALSCILPKPGPDAVRLQRWTQAHFLYDTRDLVCEVRSTAFCRKVLKPEM